MTIPSRFRPVHSVILLSFMLLSCAGQRAPQGGPIDTDPPEIIWTYPPNYTTGFSDDRIVLEFDEYVERRSVEASVFVSPHVGSLEFDWSGRRVEVRFSERLRERTTYVVIVGTDVVDLRNRNRMAHAFTLAFSTGEEIDRGAVEGRIYPRSAADSPSGVMVFAYLLTGLDPDTLNPVHTQPHYVTQTGKNGDFSFKHIALGSYRLLAVRDEYRNLLYDPEADEYGVPSVWIELTEADTMVSRISMKLAKSDTTAPRLVKVEAVDRHHLRVEFSEPMDTSGINLRYFQVIDTLIGMALPVRSLFPLLPRVDAFMLVTDEQGVEQPYRLVVERVRDPAGNLINPLANSLSFRGSAAPDTSGPDIATVLPADSARGVDLCAELTIHFTDAVRREAVAQAILLREADGELVPYAERWLSDASVSLRALRQLQGNTWYELSVRVGDLEDFVGSRGADSVRTFRFETLDEDLLSSIEGVIRDESRDDTTGVMIVAAHRVGRKDSRPTSIRVERSGAFVLSGLPEGEYALEAFRDRNDNGQLDFGKPFPFELSERFVWYPDTLKLRARWPLGGVQLILP